MYYLTPWVKRLLVLCLGVYVLQGLNPLVTGYGALIPADALQHPWTVVTYMFLHGSFWHLFFNMLGLFMFGPRLEQRIGSPDFIKLYMVGGLGGAALSFITPYPTIPVVGASAAVYAVLMAFAMYWPRERIYIYMIIPIEVWTAMLLLVAWSVYSGLTNPGRGIADFAHLGGIGFGFAYMKWREWRRGAPRREFQRQAASTPSVTLSDTNALRRWESIDTALLHELNRQEVESLLRKARSDGVRVLSPAERAFLDRMATRH